LKKPEEKPEKSKKKSRRKSLINQRFPKRKPEEKREKGQEKKQENLFFNFLIPVNPLYIYVFLKILISDKKQDKKSEKYLPFMFCYRNWKMRERQE
jgi:hypothetical protein